MTGFDWVKTIIAVALVIAAIAGNSLYQYEPLLYRVIAVILAFGLAGGVFATTVAGNSLVSFIQAATVELRRVTWPTRAELGQTTLMVLVVVAIFALALWGIDSLYSWFASLII